MQQVGQHVGLLARRAFALEHAVAVALDLRRGLPVNDLFDRLAADPRLGLSREEIAALVKSPMEFIGAARAQVAGVSERVSELTAKYPQAAAYTPGAIL